MFEITIIAIITVLSAVFGGGLVFIMRAVDRQTRTVGAYHRMMLDVYQRIVNLEIGQSRSEARTVVVEVKHLETMDRLLSALTTVQSKQNEIILKAAGFNRKEVAKLIEKQNNEGAYALLQQLGAVQSLRADALRGGQQGEREELAARQLHEADRG